MLDAWGRWYARRDEIVIAAFHARVTRTEIRRKTGLAPSTINRILAGQDDH
jgi:hypothetical protein